MILEEIVQFLKNIAPFNLLEPPVLAGLAQEMSLDFYPKDTTILKQHGPASTSLRIIKKGAVKVLMGTEEGEEITFEYKGEGDNFGFLSMIGKDRQRTTVRAVEDTICYIIQKDQVFKLLETSPAFAEYFMSYLSRYVDRTYQEMQTKSLVSGSAERSLFNTSVGQIAVNLVSVTEDTPIQAAAEVMAQNKISSLIVLNKNQLPLGIVTDRDLREKVVAKARPVTEPIKNISTLSLIRIDARESCFEALMKMVQFNIHHLLVIDEGEVRGIVTNHDLLFLQGTSPVYLSKDISNQQTLEGLLPLAAKIRGNIGMLLLEKVTFSQLSRIITELIDRLIRKVLDLTEKKLGPPPLPYCFLAFGSQGRRERMFITDQDLALVYSNSPTIEEAPELEKYFSAFSRLLGEYFQAIGLSFYPQGQGKGDYRWCYSISRWRDIFFQWIVQPTPDSILESSGFFDSRPMAGKNILFQEVRDAFPDLLRQGERRLLTVLAGQCIKHPAPVGFHKNYLVEKNGAHTEVLDLKARAIRPLVDIVRLFALDMGVKETATLNRINALKNKHSLVKQFWRELEQAFEFLMLMDIQHRFELMQTGRPPDHLLAPERLGNLERKTLREAFHLIERLQELIVEWYEPERKFG
jgi:CBS domain-containing protein